jgi:hypothetical protein
MRSLKIEEILFKHLSGSSKLIVQYDPVTNVPTFRLKEKQEERGARQTLCAIIVMFFQ